MKIDISTTPATVTIDGKEVPSWQWSNAIREAVAKEREDERWRNAIRKGLEKAREPERPENEAWMAGRRTHKGTMRVEGDLLAIRWDSGDVDRLKRSEIGALHVGDADEIAYRLAFFDRHYVAPRPENEAWYAGNPDSKGAMSVEDAHLVIRWSNGGVYRYLRNEILTGTGALTNESRAEGQRRLAFFDRHYAPKENETVGVHSGKRGTMRVVKDRLIIDWPDHVRATYDRPEIVRNTKACSEKGNAEWERRLAFFDKYRELKENEIRDTYGHVWELRWNDGKREVRTDSGSGCFKNWTARVSPFSRDPAVEAALQAKFEALRPLAENEVHLPGGAVVELQLQRGKPMVRLRGGRWTHWGTFCTPGYEEGDRWFARKILDEVGW